jgi:hypothetical protein
MGYPMAVRKTTLAIDDEILSRARDVLGTRGIRDTIDAALQEVIDARLRVRHIERLASMPDLERLRAEAWRE